MCCACVFICAVGCEVLHCIIIGNKIQLKRAEDGSGRGAALVAAVAVRMKGKL